MPRRKQVEPNISRHVHVPEQQLNPTKVLPRPKMSLPHTTVRDSRNPRYMKVISARDGPCGVLSSTSSTCLRSSHQKKQLKPSPSHRRSTKSSPTSRVVSQCSSTSYSKDCAPTSRTSRG